MNNQKRIIKVGLLGLGTVGGGTLNILKQSQADIARRFGEDLQIEVVMAAVRDLNRPRTADMEGVVLTDQPEQVVTHPDIDVVIELMGGTTLAKTLLTQAIEQGKHIVTANKALIAEHGEALFALAQNKGVNLYYEAAVAGGIPIIKALREGLAANNIEWVAGIINGTGNYILTEMQKPDADFASVLKRAQELGYAEADPTFDVEGIDAAHKLTILASIAFGIPLQFEKVYTEGISQITAEDIHFAEQMGYAIKHLGIATQDESGYSLRVHPALVSKSVLLAQVDGVMNAVMTYGNHVGATLYYGAGAGAGPTASAVVADLIDCIRDMSCTQSVPSLGFADLNQDKPVQTISEIESAYYLRFFAKDHAGVLARVTSILADSEISIETLHQAPCQQKPEDATLVMLTNTVKESNLEKALAALNQLPEVDGEVMRIRIADLAG